VIHYRRSGHRTVQVARSQLAVRLAIFIYAGVCMVVALRCAVLILHFPDSVWTVRSILGATAPLLRPLLLIPGASRALVGGATLADFTLVLLLAAAPLAMLARPGAPPRSGMR
jgi:hypothetical protein